MLIRGPLASQYMAAMRGREGTNRVFGHLRRPKTIRAFVKKALNHLDWGLRRRTGLLGNQFVLALQRADVVDCDIQNLFVVEATEEDLFPFRFRFELLLLLFL